MLVQQHELGIKSGFHRKLAQQAHAETMDRRDHSAIERALVAHPAGKLGATRISE